MNRIDQCFEKLAKANKKALIPFITAGDPNLDSTLPMLDALVSGGADIIELGVPFSDPMADGPVIQRSSERALKNSVSLGNVLDTVNQFRKKNNEIPVILMGYLNPVEVMGYEKFASRASKSGVDGILIVDMPPEESDIFKAIQSPSGISVITNYQRFEIICYMQ